MSIAICVLPNYSDIVRSVKGQGIAMLAMSLRCSETWSVFLPDHVSPRNGSRLEQLALQMERTIQGAITLSVSLLKLRKVSN